MKNINFACRPYFSEQGNVDDDVTFITIFLVSFNQQSCCLMQSPVCSLQSAVCKCRTPVLYWPVEQPNTSCEHIKLTFLFNVRFSWVILWSKSIWNKPNVSNLTSVILRWKEHLFRMHSLQRQSVYTTLSYCTEVRLKIRTKKTDLLRISIGSKAPRDRVSH